MTHFLLLPGMDGSGAFYDDFAARLAPLGTTQIASYPPDRPLGYDELADWLAPQLPRGDWVLFAESFAGPLAILTAARRPPGLRALILCATFAHLPPPWTRVMASFVPVLPAWALPMPVLAQGLFGRDGDAAWSRRLAGVLSGVAPAVMAARARSALRVDVREQARSLRLPVLYLRAGRDRVVPRRAGSVLAQLVQDLRIRDIDGPHFLAQFRSQACIDETAAFLRCCGVLAADPDLARRSG
ncbi:alpha/beta fold hydrolase [Tahibacter amnicola]|uniref:Lysophospholipase n=1 Tax=Tahibacter amnicola TaxID=2976241 RepID=A0ABY6BE59_9GAMM|nr:lysophospholipase [Tahibacter amnicola]UXI67837.1 lysophospholipase [Tahibacter amnicola]